MKDENVVVDNSNTTEEVVLETTEETEKVEDVDWKSEAEKAKELANNYKIRAEKAEKKAKESVTTETKENQLSLADLRAISSVHEDDVERVEKFAKSEGISIKEALKNEELKAILDLRVEKRNTADASNVNNSRRTSAKVSDETLISNANQGKIPDNDSDIERLITAKSKKK